MNIDNMTYGELKKIAELFAGVKPASNIIQGDLRPVIVRARDAGVHYGKLISYEGRIVHLQDSRRLWSWSAKLGIALSGVATHGVNASKSKIDVLVSKIVILDACEIIDCTEEAAINIESV
jgi:hypothetical protein